jgi:hypothetical protein
MIDMETFYLKPAYWPVSFSMNIKNYDVDCVRGGTTATAYIELLKGAVVCPEI